MLLAEIQPQIAPWMIPALIIGILVQFLWSGVVSLMIHKLSKTDRNIEMLKAELHTLTTKLVDERFRAMTHEINNHVNGFKLTLDTLSTSLMDARKNVDALYDGDHKLELAVVEKVSAANEKMTSALVELERSMSRRFEDFKSQAVTRQDLNELKREINK